MPSGREAQVDNEDTRRIRTKVELGEPQLPPSDAFMRALLKLQAVLDALGAAISAVDPDAFEASAADAFSFLLAATAIFRRLETAEPPDPQRIGIAWYALRTHHRAVLDLFERAKTWFPSPELQLRIEQHRISLTLAMHGLGPRETRSGR